MNRTNKILSRLILTGLLISSLPKPLSAQENKETSNLSKQQLEKDIDSLRKTTKRTRKLEKTIPLLLGGFAVILFIVSLALGAPLFALNTAGAGALAGFLGMLAVTGWIGSGATFISAPLAFVGLSVKKLYEANKKAKKIEETEKKNPGTLTREQKVVVAQFKNLWNGPFIRGIRKGNKLKKTSEQMAKKVAQENPELAKFFNKKNIKNYIWGNWKLRNASAAKKAYDEKIEKRKKARNVFSKWSPAYHAANAEVLKSKLSPIYLQIKITHKYWTNKMNKREKQLKAALKKADKLKEYEEKIKTAVKEFIDEADSVVAEFQKPVL